MIILRPPRRVQNIRACEIKFVFGVQFSKSHSTLAGDCALLKAAALAQWHLPHQSRTTGALPSRASKSPDLRAIVRYLRSTAISDRVISKCS